MSIPNPFFFLGADFPTIPRSKRRGFAGKSLAPKQSATAEGYGPSLGPAELCGVNQPQGEETCGKSVASRCCWHIGWWVIKHVWINLSVCLFSIAELSQLLVFCSFGCYCWRHMNVVLKRDGIFISSGLKHVDFEDDGRFFWKQRVQIFTVDWNNYDGRLKPAKPNETFFFILLCVEKHMKNIFVQSIFWWQTCDGVLIWSARGSCNFGARLVRGWWTM